MSLLESEWPLAFLVDLNLELNRNQTNSIYDSDPWIKFNIQVTA